MKHVPQIAFFVVIAALIATSLIDRWSSPPGRDRVALSVSMQSGHFSIQAELGAALLALKL